MGRLRRAGVFLQRLKLGQGDNCGHGTAVSFNNEVVTLIKNFIKHLAEVYTGFACIDCLGRWMRLDIPD